MALLKEWQTTYFNISLWDWVNASNASTLFKLFAQGTCEISLMRAGGDTDDKDDLLVVGLPLPLLTPSVPGPSFHCRAQDSALWPSGHPHQYTLQQAQSIYFG